jgi:hypothetical protein
MSNALFAKKFLNIPVKKTVEFKLVYKDGEELDKVEMSNILWEAYIWFNLFKKLATCCPFHDQVKVLRILAGLQQPDYIGMAQILMDKNLLLDIVIWTGFSLGAGYYFNGYCLISSLVRRAPDAKNWSINKIKPKSKC